MEFMYCDDPKETSSSFRWYYLFVFQYSLKEIWYFYRHLWSMSILGMKGLISQTDYVNLYKVKPLSANCRFNLLR